MIGSWVFRNRNGLMAATGFLIFAVFIGNIIWRTYYPYHIVDIIRVQMQTAAARPGELVWYEVEINKRMLLTARVTRYIVADDRKIRIPILPDLVGSLGVGHFVSRRHFVVPPETPQGHRYRLVQTFSYFPNTMQERVYRMESINDFEVPE